MSSLGGTSSTYWFCTIDNTSVNSLSCSYVAPLSEDLLATEPPSESVRTASSEPITNAFFMESPSTSLPEPVGGVHGLALEPHLEVETRPCQRAGVTHRPDPLPLPHVVALLHQHLGDVSVERVEVVAVVKNDQVPVAFEPSRVHDVAGVDGRHLGALGGLDVH